MEEAGNYYPEGKEQSHIMVVPTTRAFRLPNTTFTFTIST